MNLPVQFFINQLINNKQDLKNFNSFNKIQIKVENNQLLFWTTEHKKGYCKEWWSYNMLSEEHIELFVRTCLSRIRSEYDEAVLGVLDGIKIQRITRSLMTSFNDTLYDGHTLDIALQVLHDQMHNIVPKYREFIQNKLNQN